MRLKRGAGGAISEVLEFVGGIQRLDPVSKMA